jgi:antitoxin ParD1/3/4
LSLQGLAIFANEIYSGIETTAFREQPMPTRNVNLTEELDAFVTSRIRSGRYESASEVIRTALRTLEREEQEHEAKIAVLKAAMEEGLSSGIVTGDVFARIRKKLNLPKLEV